LDGELKITHLVFGVMARSSASGFSLKPEAAVVATSTGVPPPSATISG